MKKSMGKISFQETENSVPSIPTSIIFSKNNPFSTSEKKEDTSENLEDEDFTHLTYRLNSTIMEKRKSEYFNQKIYDFNENRKTLGLGFLSEECRNYSYSHEQIIAKPVFNLKTEAFNSYLSDRLETSYLNHKSSKARDKMLLINDTLDFLKKMQSFDIFEEEFLLDEKQEFEKNTEYLEYLDGVVREEAFKQESIPSIPQKISASSSTKTSALLKDKKRFSYNFQTQIPKKTEERSQNDRYRTLLQSILEGNIENVKLALQDMSQFELNSVNSEGQSLLLIATKLAKKNNVEYSEIVRLLLTMGADPKIKDKRSWGPLDEAISHSNVKTTLYLFDYLTMLKRDFFQREKEMILSILERIPDFYLEMKWEFESSMIPLIGKLAPSDTFKIWKYKNSMRMDYSLVGMKNLKTKKREMSLLFNPTNDINNRADVKTFNSGKSIDLFWLLNRTKNTFTNPLQEIDFFEKKTILYDLMTSQAFEGNMNIIKCDLNESVNWIGNKVSQKINGWKAKKFDFLLTYEYTLNKKERLPVDVIKSTPNSKKNSSKNSDEKEDFNLFEKIEKMNFVLPAKRENKTKRNSASIWISEDFPLKFNVDLWPIFQFLSNGNSMMSKLSTILQNQKIQEITKSNGFPVKVQIPISFTIRANISFLSFRFLNPQENYKSHLEIAHSMPYCDRKIAMKILTRTKKRMILTNTLI